MSSNNDWFNYIYDPNVDWTPTTWVGAEGTLGDQAGDFPPYIPDPYGPGSGWGQDTLSNMKIADDTAPSFTDRAIGGLRKAGSFLGGRSGGTGGGLRGLGGALGNIASSPGGVAALMALLSYLDRQKPSGGGTATAYAGARPVQRQMVQGKYGPIAQYAANGGVMHAYREGGKVQMEDGGFVLTKRAVDGAGGPNGVASIVPGAKMIYGPGTGTSDDVPAQINGRHGAVEARLSNGEAYVSPKDVADNGGIKKMYAAMRQLERRA